MVVGVSKRLLSFMVGITVVFAASAEIPAARAQASEQVRSDSFCVVQGYLSGEPAFHRVQASCRGIGLILGDAERFEVFQNTALQATLVELEASNSRRVLLLRPDGHGGPLVEDLTGTLATWAGRAPWSNIDGVAIDYTQFATTGTIAVQGAGGQVESRPRGGNGQALSIGEHIQSDRTRVAAQ
jgi:hypothetical protein